MAMIAESFPPPVICQRYVLDDNQVSETFDLLDTDKDGRLSRNEIAALLRTIKVEPTRIELDYIFKEMDLDKSGKISKEDFVRYMRCPSIHRTTLKAFERLFHDFDTDGDGYITKDEMTQVLREALDLDDAEMIDQMFSATDTDNDGRINFREFVKMMGEKDVQICLCAA